MFCGPTGMGTSWEEAKTGNTSPRSEQLQDSGCSQAPLLSQPLPRPSVGCCLPD